MSHHYGRAVKEAAKAIQGMTPLDAPKSVPLAAIIRLLFGPVGVALYFRSGKDFLLCLAMLLFSVFIMGIGVIFGWLFSAGYGAWRAHTSNERLRLSA
jgi:hypothetical protein